MLSTVMYPGVRPTPEVKPTASREAMYPGASGAPKVKLEVDVMMYLEDLRASRVKSRSTAMCLGVARTPGGEAEEDVRVESQLSCTEVGAKEPRDTEQKLPRRPRAKEPLGRHGMKEPHGARGRTGETTRNSPIPMDPDDLATDGGDTIPSG